MPKLDQFSTSSFRGGAT